MNFLLILTILLAPASVYNGKQLIPDEMSTSIPPEPSASAPIELSAGSVSSGPFSGMEFVTIPSGTFMMGSPGSEDDRCKDEGPDHSVSISSFELMTTEVTQGIWEAVMGESAFIHHEMVRGAGDNYPMYNVSWNDCQEFIAKLNALDSSYMYRLPSESEWEYACRAGTTTRFYWGDSDSESTMNQYCWYSSNSNSSNHPVALKQANFWGLYDMSGNVWEWCEDTWPSDYSGTPTDGRALVFSGASSRITRGGSWNDSAKLCRSAYRNYCSDYEVSQFLNIGFRLARSVR